MVKVFVLPGEDIKRGRDHGKTKYQFRIENQDGFVLHSGSVVSSAYPTISDDCATKLAREYGINDQSVEIVRG